jgi:type I restriction enzyme S subunit
MSSEWKEKALGELTENFDGQRIPVKESERKSGNYPYYGASGIVDRVDKYIFDGEYLLIAEDGENLRTQKTPIAFLARGKFWVNNHAHIVTGNAQSDTRFLMYALNNANIHGYLTGSTMPKLTQGNLNRIPIFAPPPDEQRAIASILGALDDKIALNRRMNETLEALAQTIFKSLFVDSTATKLPKGWRFAKISELCEINSWTLNKNDELDRVEYVEISEVTRGNIGNIQPYDRGDEPTRARRRLRHGDTVLSTVRPDRGSYFLSLNPSPNLIASTGFAVLTPTKTPWSFIHAAMTQTATFEYLGQHADGGAYPAVRPEIIGALEVPWPDKSEIPEEFHRVCAPLYERAEHNRRESRTLAELRDALLPKLLSGELRVPASFERNTAK